MSNNIPYLGISLDFPCIFHSTIYVWILVSHYKIISVIGNEEFFPNSLILVMTGFWALSQYYILHISKLVGWQSYKYTDRDHHLTWGWQDWDAMIPFLVLFFRSQLINLRRIVPSKGKDFIAFCHVIYALCLFPTNLCPDLLFSFHC